MIDLTPATTQMAELLRNLPDDALGKPTPCPAYTLGDLVDHVGGLTLAFIAAARKDARGGTQGPSGDASRLDEDWRVRIPSDLAGLAHAWRDPRAWAGMTLAGGVEMPGEVAGSVVVDELVVHGWDVARASGQAYDCHPELLDAVHHFVVQFSGPGSEAERDGLFGPVVDVPADAALLDRVVGLAGRDPAWSPA